MKSSAMGFIPRVKQQYADNIISLMEWKQPRKQRTEKDMQLIERYKEIWNIYNNKELAVQPKSCKYDYVLHQIEADNNVELIRKFTSNFFEQIQSNNYPLNKTSTKFFQFLQKRIRNNYRLSKPSSSWIWTQAL